MNNRTLVMPYFDNPSMLEIQVENWREFEDWNLLIIDDCSPDYPASEIIGPEEGLYLYRVKTPYPWHQHGARNLGAKVCKTDWALFTDMDHLLRPEDAKYLAGDVLDPNHFYAFARVTAPEMKPYKPHCNSFLVTIEKYWEAGGYDEDYCDPSGPPEGCYGGDGPFLRRLSRTVSGIPLDIALVRYPREHVADASTTQFDRKGVPKENYRKKFVKKRANNNEVPKNPIRFDWEEVYG